ncbi:unnamed protein product [Diatraea saccharalis]|uniref:ADP-ribosylation factor-like protein 6 n=1 Tax=Diatraea saccharalis TaxID=40085 RepID=A0A9N9RA93_9NEOP|nr:unnamed protein product [Diatraea saccharalis]
MMVISAAACAAGAAEVGAFPALAASRGLAAALLLAALLAAAYALFAALAVPETRGRDPRSIYRMLERNATRTDETRHVGGHREDDDANRRPVTPSSGGSGGMGLLEKLSSWLGRGRTEVTVLVLGLDNSGKSTLLDALRPPEQRARHLAPTVALQQDHFQSGGVSFSAWDVSGAPRHRALWERHYRRAHALVFVVDSSDRLRLGNAAVLVPPPGGLVRYIMCGVRCAVVAREELELLLCHPDVCGRRVPLLVFANKCDAPHALAPAQVAAGLGLERIADKPWHICASNALSGAGLTDGISWLARQIRDLHIQQH